jgi:hypothetical protein
VTPAEASAAHIGSIEHLEFVADSCLVIFDVARRTARTPPPAGCTSKDFDRLFAQFAKNGTWLTPTIGSFRIWVNAEQFNAIFATFSELVPLIRKHRIPILAGTDNGNRGIVPGKSLHEELELLVKAGFTPLEALRAATVNAARFLKLKNPPLGQLGQPADLVLLDANPLEDIRNTQRIVAVYRSGKKLARE